MKPVLDGGDLCRGVAAISTADAVLGHGAELYRAAPVLADKRQRTGPIAYLKHLTTEAATYDRVGKLTNLYVWARAIR